MSYSQAAELTLPQVVHALGIERRAASDAGIARELGALQGEILDRIAARRRRLPMELAGMAVGDLAEQIGIETGVVPGMSSLAAIVGRYVAERGAISFYKS